VTPFELHHREAGRLADIETLLETIMSAVTDIAAATQVCATVAADIQTAINTLSADVTALTAQLAAGGTPPDTTALNASAAALSAAGALLAPAVNAVTALTVTAGPPVTS
jgi:hypothetical protein